MARSAMESASRLPAVGHLLFLALLSTVCGTAPDGSFTVDGEVVVNSTHAMEGDYSWEEIVPPPFWEAAPT